MKPVLKRVGFRLDEKDFEKLRKYCFKTRLSIQYLMEKAVRDLVNQKNETGN